MKSENEPLRENEVGAFGELAKRPNPDNLVIVNVPAIEDFLPFLQQQLGRELTAEDIELHRRKSPAIAVSKTAAEEMQAARASRPPITPTPQAPRVPTVKGSYEAMPTEAKDRHECAEDVFGQHLFFLRNHLLERLRNVVESDDIRKRIGTLHRKEYDAIAALAPADRDAALALARKSIDLYMQEILGLLTDIGDSMRFGDKHAINYRLVLEVKNVETDEVVEEFDINRDGKKVFYANYGRWLNRFGGHR